MNSTIEKRNRRLKIKLSCSHSKVDRAISSHTGKCISCEQHEARKDGLSTPKEVKSPALIRAEEIQSNLEPAFPSFLKALVRSHVGSCFWMGLPGPFCRANLPKEDTTVTLENEDGKEFNIKYIGYKTGLSAGWRQFCVAHKLLEGDVLVFQLVANCRFKVCSEFIFLFLTSIIIFSLALVWVAWCLVVVTRNIYKISLIFDFLSLNIVKLLFCFIDYHFCPIFENMVKEK
ncbi:B3 domain-containing protein Os05g0481400 [Linum perenne]